MKNILTIIFALIFGFGGGFLADYLLEDTAPEALPTERIVIEEDAYTEAIEKVSPSVFSVIATKDVAAALTQPFDPFGFFTIPEAEPETVRREVGGGTGFLITEDGLAITNKHVVSDTEADYTVFLNDKSKYYVQVVSIDPANDIAVIQLYEDEAKSNKAKGLTPVELGDSAEARIGSRVLAIGNALGEFENTSTAGIISAKNRSIKAADQLGRNASTLSGLLQTDTAINPGNSGGPLINLAGQVIGINTAVASEANGIGFAIPVNDVKPALESVEKYGEIVRPFIGIRYTIIDKEVAAELGLGEHEGAYLSNDVANAVPAVVPESPADKAGLKSEDIITKVNDEAVNQDNDLLTIMRQYAPGDTVTLTVIRAGEEIKVELTLAKFDESVL